MIATYLFNVMPAPVAAVSTEVLAQGQAAAVVGPVVTMPSIFDMFIHAEFIAQAVMILLIASSVRCWAIAIEKRNYLKLTNQRMKKFEQDFWSGMSLEQLFNKKAHWDGNPLAMVFAAAIEEWNAKAGRQTDGFEGYELRLSTRDRINRAMHLATSRSSAAVEKNLSFLATVGSSAPFIGLFGTVWGIMSSFQAIAASKNTTLAVVAPGIAEALLATALGLAAAIPAVIFYNKFVSEVDAINSKVSDFVLELSTVIAREMEKK